MKFQVYGFKCSRTKKLVDSCTALIGQLQDQSTLELIQDAERMRVLNINNTPALAVDGQLLFQGCGMSVEGLEQMLKKHGLKT